MKPNRNFQQHRNFQQLGPEQGQWFEDTCVKSLEYAGFTVNARRQHLTGVEVEVDIIATNTHAISFYIDCKGSLQGERPGLIRTDTLKKAIAELLLLHHGGWGPLLLMASHIPENGAGKRWLEIAHQWIPFITVNPLTDSRLLHQLALADEQRIRQLYGLQ